MNISKLYFIGLCILLLSCTNGGQSNDRPVSDDEPESKVEFSYDQSLVSDFPPYADLKIEELNFFEVATFDLDIGQDTKAKAILYNCEGWENDPGDFRKVVIELSGKKSLELVNLDGWIKVDGEYFFTTLDIGSSLLVLEGYPYASDPPLLTIIRVAGDNSGVVFNGGYQLSEIKDLGNEQYELISSFDGQDAIISANASGLSLKN